MWAKHCVQIWDFQIKKYSLKSKNLSEDFIEIIAEIRVNNTTHLSRELNSIDKVKDVNKIKEFEVEFLSFLHEKHQKVLDDLADGKLTDDISLKWFFDNF